MLNLYTSVLTKNISEERFSEGERLSVLYHGIFDYPLNFAELIKWKISDKCPVSSVEYRVSEKNGYFFLEEREALIYKRLLRKRISEKKLQIAKKAVRILSFIPSIKMVAVTGSLAMQNSTDESDIDLMIITKKGSLWTTRLFAYLSFVTCHLSFRRPFDKSQKDKLCLNMWMDESDLVFRSRNLYTAHEIAQVIPLVNKDKIYEKFLWKNRWVLKFWPNSLKIKNLKLKIENSRARFSFLEWLAYKLQFFYMRSKITRETVTPTRALFHPQDWGKVVLDRLQSFP